MSGCRYDPTLPLINSYEKIFNEKKEDMAFEFGSGAQFIVSKKKILQKPKEFYLKIIELLNMNRQQAWVIERFHKLIFN